jgi:hypothetical protein
MALGLLGKGHGRAAAVGEVGDDLVFGLQQGVRARLQDACGLLNGDTESGRCDRFAAILCRVLALWLCGCWDRRFRPRTS